MVEKGVTVKAAQINTYGDASVVQVNEVPIPTPDKQSVLVEVYGSSLNPADTVLRSGTLKDMITVQLPITIGGDIAGVVKAVGEEVTLFQTGDKVYGQAFVFYGDSGAFAEYAAVSQQHLAKIPTSLDLYQAASLPLVGISAVQAIEEYIRLRPNQKILIHGGAGGVGAMAIQLAKYIGAYVATTVSSKDTGYVTSLGADEIIDYETQDFSTMLTDYDAVIDLVANKTSATGGDIFQRSLQVLKPDGTIVSLVAYFGQEAIDAAKKRGFNAVYQLTKVTTDSLSRLAVLVDKGVITPRIAKSYYLDDIQAAFTDLETNHPGKIMLRMR